MIKCGAKCQVWHPEAPLPPSPGTGISLACRAMPAPPPLAVTKFSVVVQLLMGEIPPRSVFRQPESAQALHPYLQLTSAVRCVAEAVLGFHVFFVCFW